MFSADKARQTIDLVNCLNHTGDFYGKPFGLLPWQTEIISDVYGTLTPSGLRQYRTAYIEIPKKNGKTELVAALGIRHLVLDKPGGEIYCCAADRKQASLVYNAACVMVEQDAYLSKIIKIRKSSKELLAKGTKLAVLSAEAYTKHGLNPSVVIFDELHAQPGRDFWDVMTFGSGAAREEPLLLVITTAGDDPDKKSIGWEIHKYSLDVINGDITDPTWYAKIYAAPEDCDIYDEAVWYASNPSLGTTIKIETLREEANRAKNSEAAEKLFRWLRLNQWISLKRIGWLPITLWDATDGQWKRDYLRGRPCYVGIDLSSRIDITAVWSLFPPIGGDDKWYFFGDAWIPENNIAERVSRDHVPYDLWVKNNYLRATPGNVVDYSYIRDYIIDIDKKHNVKYYCADPWHLEILRQILPREIADKFIEIPQTMAGMSPGMAELERLFRGGKISHEETPLGRWSFGNVIVATDGNENIKPMKNKSYERIDPTVALINAASGAIRLEKKRSVYEGRGLRVI